MISSYLRNKFEERHLFLLSLHAEKISDDGYYIITTPPKGDIEMAAIAEIKELTKLLDC